MELKLNMGLRHQLRMVVKIICPTCGVTGGHQPFCPQPMLEHVLKMRKAVKCPDCHAHSVDLNSDDFYECRKCHVVFSTGHSLSERKNRRVLLDVPGVEDLVLAVVKSTPGRGEIPVDLNIERWTKECEAWRTKRLQGRKKKSR